MSEPGGRRFFSWPLTRPALMAIVNVTPDSFSDGGRWLDTDAAVHHALTLIEEGADIIDIGGESTRPGADLVDATTEMERVCPVIREIRARDRSIPISIDTTKVAVAEAALDAGADIINDVSAGAEPGMFECAAGRAAAMVVMHRRGTARTMQTQTEYDDVVADVHGFLLERAETALQAGLSQDSIWLDPGIGFGKDVDGNLALIANIGNLAQLGFPVVLGASRKSFIGGLTNAPVNDRLAGSLAALVPCIGISRVAVRVHDVKPTRQFLDIGSHILGVAS